MIVYQYGFYTLKADRNALVYCLSDPQTEIPLAWPALEIDGSTVRVSPERMEIAERRFLSAAIEQITLA